MGKFHKGDIVQSKAYFGIVEKVHVVTEKDIATASGKKVEDFPAFPYYLVKTNERDEEFKPFYVWCREDELEPLDEDRYYTEKRKLAESYIQELDAIIWQYNELKKEIKEDLN